MKILLAVLLSLISFSSWGLSIPQLTGPVVDQAKLFSSLQKSNLEKEIRLFRENNGPHLQVLTINSLEDEILEDYTIEVVEEWKIGDEEKDDGLLIFLSKNDRKVRIEVGDGLEGIITDYRSSQIIELMLPYFKQGAFAAGITAGTMTIMKLIRGENPDLPKGKKEKENPIITLIFFLFVIFFGAFGKRRRGYLSGYSSFGSSGSSSSWGGGGGSFSGGGSSGSW